MKRWLNAVAAASLFCTMLGAPQAYAAPRASTDVPGGSITTSVTWTLAGSPYIVHGFVSIASGGSLTVEPGVVVQFDTNQWMQVQAGGVLTATGTSGQPISFTSSAAVPVPGDWQDVVVSGTATFQHCDFSYGAGGGHWSQIEINSSNVVVEDCAVHDGLRDGIRLWGDPGITPTLRNLTITNNGQAAIRMIRPDNSPLLDNLTLSGNGLDALTWDSNGAAAAHVTLNGGALNGAPIQGGGLQLSAGTHLTLTAGTSLKIGTGGYLQVPSGAEVVAAGTVTQPVTITSAAAVPAPGDWKGIYIQGGGAATFRHCDIGYAGGSDWWWNIEVDSANVLLEDCVVHHGVHDGVRFEGTGALAPALRNVSIHNNAGAAIYSGARVSPQLQNITLAGNGLDAMQLAGGALAGDHLTLQGDELNGAPIVLLGDLGINAGSVVTLTPGTTLAFAAQKQISVSDGSSLIADGTPSHPITFTTASASPAPGQWGRIGVGFTGANLLLDHCVVRYGGYGGNPVVELQTDGLAQVTHCLFEHNQADAIRVNAELEGMQADHNTFRDVGYGVRYITGLPGGVAASPIDARFSSWDDPSGPFNAARNPDGLGVGVDDYVLFEPWDEGVPGDAPDLVTTVSAAAGPWNPGDNLSISYAVTNAGAQATSATAWEDAFYFSDDQLYDPGDVLLGAAAHAGGLAPGAGYTGTINAPVPVLAEKPWYVLAVADHNYQSGDADRSTNTGASAPVLVQVSSLPMNATTPGTAAWPQGALYKFTPSTGGNVRLSLAAPSPGWLLSVRALNAPTPSDYLDRSWQGVVRLRSLPPVPHYVWIKPPNVGPNVFSLTAQTFTLPEPLSIDSVSPNPVTVGLFPMGPASADVTVRGTGFTPSTTVTLLDPDTEVVMGGLRYLDENTLRVTVSAGDHGCVLPCGGTFDVQVQEGAQTATLPGGLTASLQLYDGGPLPDDRPPCELSLSLNTPPQVRSLREFPVTVNWENRCGDLSPQVAVVASDNARFRFPGDPAPRGQYLELLITNQGEGPPDLIPTGATGSLLVMAQPITGGAHIAVPVEVGLMQATSCEPFGVTQRIVCQPTHFTPPLYLYRPNHLSDSDWISLTNGLGLAGAATQTYLDWLAAEAVRLDRLGVQTADVQQVIASALNWRIDPGVIERQYVGALGYGVPDPTHLLLAANAFGDRFLEQGSVRRGFLLQPNGGWRSAPVDGGHLSESGGIFTLRERDGTVLVFLADGRLDYVEDPNGNRLTANYSAQTLTGYTDSLGDTTTFGYNGQGRLATITDAVGRVTTLSYSASGEHLLSVAGPQGTVQFEYSTATDLYRRHAVTRITYPDGTTLDLAYDTQGRLTSRSVNGNHATLAFAYDSTTGAVTVTDALGHTVTGEEAAGLARRLTDSLGQVSNVAMDGFGRLSQFLGGGAAAALRYDGRGNPTAAIDGLGRAVRLGYEPGFNQVTSFTDTGGHPTRLEYDAQGNLTAAVRVDGTRTMVDYDPHGWPVEVTNRRGQAITLSYDAKGLVTRKDYPDGRYILYGYDSHRNLTQTVQVSGTTWLTTSLTYDGADRLARVTYPTGRFVDYTYDGAGRLATLADPGGFTLTYDYDAFSRLWKVRDGGTALVTYSYDAADRLVRAQNANGTATTYEYDGSGRVSRVALLGPGDVPQEEFVYTFDAFGRRLTMTTSQGTTTYAYDAGGQLTAANLAGGPALTYAYDLAGNRAQTTENASPTAYSANTLNQYTTVGGSPLTYDLDGNLLTLAGATYQWDADGNLVGLAAPGETWSFEYDVFGNRSAAVRNGLRTEYLIDPSGLGDVIAEYDGSGSLVARYVHGIGLVSRIAGGNAAYYGFDGNGNTALVTDAAGAVVNTYRYRPFGDLSTSSEAVPNPFRFGGKWGLLQAASLTLIRARAYNPLLGRFLSEEPSELVPLQGYMFAGNDPVNGTDLDGYRPTWLSTGLDWAGNTTAALENSASLMGYAYQQMSNTAFQNAAVFARQPVASWTQVARDGRAAAFRQLNNLRTGTATSLGTARGYNTVANSYSKAASNFRIAGAVLEFGSGAVKTADDWLRYRSNPTADNLAQVWDTGGRTVLKTVAALTPIPFSSVISDKVVDGADRIWGGMVYDITYRHYTPYQSQDDIFGPGVIRRKHWRPSDQVTSGDPNDLQGPLGYGAPGWLAPQEMLYTIHFENVPTATAPAALVLITHTLDSDLDPASVRFWGYSFGDIRRAFGTPQAAIDEVVDAGDLLGVAVRITATAESGRLTWLFSTLDPDTGGAPAPWLAIGFLPPNTAAPEGEGWVVFSAQPLTGTASGTAVNAQARVFFDDNPFIDTNVHLNTLDTVAPTASVSSMPTMTQSIAMTVSWSGSDADSGLAGYDVWVAENGGEWGLWQSSTLATSAVFTPTAGTRYDFVATAADNAGNRPAPAPPSQAYTIVQVLLKVFMPLVRR
jgi:RHS repeat-associated protein